MNKLDRLIERAASVVIAVVVGAVFLGFFRLAFDHLGFIVLSVLSLLSAYYIYSHSEWR